MTYYTVKQLAEKFGVSVQAIHKELKKDEYQSFIEKKNINSHSTMVVSEIGLNKLNQHFKRFNQSLNQFIKPSKSDDSNNNGASNLNQFNQDDSNKNNSNKAESISLINQLKEQNNELKHTIAILEKETNQLHTELQHEQELHLMDQKQVKELENKLKMLEKPNEDKEIKKEPPKKWWQFWK